jgi:hypothetical protein
LKLGYNLEDPSKDGRTFTIDLKGISLGDVECIHLAQDTENMRIFVNTVVELRIPWNAVNFLNG